MKTLHLHCKIDDKTQTFNSYREYKEHFSGARQVTYGDGNWVESNFNNLYQLQAHNVSEWFHMLEEYKQIGATGRAAVKWLIVMLPNGCSMVRAIELAHKVKIYKGYELDYVTEFVNETFNMAHKLGHLTKYFDYAGYCFDLQRDRKIDKVIYQNECYTITNADQFNVWGI